MISSQDTKATNYTGRTLSLRELFRNNIRQYFMLLALVGIMIFFQVSTDGTLLRPLNLTNLLLQNSYIVIMAIGMLLVIVAGHIDLSVGSIVGFIGALAAVMIVQMDVHYVPATLLCLLMGAAIGAAQGALVAFLKIPSFIVTLGGMLILRGLSLTILDGRSVGPFPTGFQRLSSGFIPDLFGAEGLHLTSLLVAAVVCASLVFLSWRERQNQRKYDFDLEPLPFFLLKNLVVVGAIMYLSYLLSSYKGFPNVLIIMFILMIVYTFVATQTTLGRRIYALGGNTKAAKLSGIKTDRLVLYTFINLGVLSALAGLVFAARLNTATPKAGNAFELDVIAAVFIGGAAMTGGVGTVIGAVIGAFIMGVLNNGMSIMGVGIDFQQVIKGVVLLAAVFFDVYSKKTA